MNNIPDDYFENEPSQDAIKMSEAGLAKFDAETDQLKRMVAFLALHEPARQEDHMVYEVWQDGEITLTKGADLWRQRSLHCIHMGVNPEWAMPVDSMPVKMNGHGSITVRDHATAKRAHDIVAAYATAKRAATA